MKVLNIIKNIVLDIIIVVLIISIIFSYMNRKKPVPLFNYYFFTVLTGSMQDTLQIGDSIIVKKTDKYRVGDIVTYKKESSYITHRIIKINGNKITTKGDANNDEDPSFDKKYILGKFVYKSTWLNFLVKYRLFIVLFIIIIYLIENILKTKNKKVVDDAS